jgi:ferredoxin/flavodoxin---NADP+ reductase
MTIANVAKTGVFQIAVVGGGPGGFYTAEALLRSGVPLAIDMFERLPVPYGLVRFGVAPDHPKLKQVTAAFDRIARAPGFRFIGGVAVGSEVTIDELRAIYDAVILATGADVSRSLGIPGETLRGVHHAGDFVGWYNGHPDFRDHHFDLDHEVAMVVGHGNVALDVARILAKSADELRHTDITAHALEVLAESRIREVHVVGRGRPAQARFTAKELREFLSLGECDAAVERRDITPEDFAAEPPHDAEMNEKLELLGDFSRKTPTSRKRCLFRFGLSPVAIKGRNRIEAIVLEQQESRATEEIGCGLCFRSIGRQTAPIAGVPYDDHRGVHANIEGRVAIGAAIVSGLYVSGWSKRGPSGTIGTNRACGTATAEAVLADLPELAGRRTGDADTLFERLRARSEGVVGYADWLKIDSAEKRRGAARGKPREKFVVVSDMLDAMDGSAERLADRASIPGLST